jgi:alpha-tubulin suppressor-like RCC1 family protein
MKIFDLNIVKKQIYISYKNKIYVSGNNRYGQLGLDIIGNFMPNHFIDLKETTNFINLKNIILIRENNIIFSNKTNEIIGIGLTEYGELSQIQNTKITNNIITGFNKIKFNIKKPQIIVGGENHTIIKDENGDVWGCGKNIHGQLTKENMYNINDIFLLNDEIYKNSKKIICGDNHTIVEDENGEVWGRGNNQKGQLGYEHLFFSKDFKKLPFFNPKTIFCIGNSTIIENEYGEVFACGNNNYGILGINQKYIISNFTKIEGISNIKNIKGNKYHIIIETQNNETFITGYNSNNEINNSKKFMIDCFEKINNINFENIYLLDKDVLVFNENKNKIIFLNNSNDLNNKKILNKLNKFLKEKNETEYNILKKNNKKLLNQLNENSICDSEKLDISFF